MINESFAYVFMSHSMWMHVFADGSVHFIKASMDIRQFVKLISRQGQDITPNDF